MTKEKSKDKKSAAGCSGFDCKPENFKKMFEKMEKCWAGKDGFPDCSAMMAGMMGAFGSQNSEDTEACCEPIANENE